MNEMKKAAIALAAVVACIIAVWSGLWYGCGVKRIWEGDLTAAFAIDLHDFLLNHRGVMPHDWKEFEVWQTQRDGKVRWEASATEERFELLAPPYAVTNEYPKVVRAKSASSIHGEAHINRLLNCAWRELGMTNNWANPSGGK